jgi:hypothetical protein
MIVNETSPFEAFAIIRVHLRFKIIFRDKGGLGNYFFTTEARRTRSFKPKNNVLLLNDRQMDMDFIKVFLFPDSVLSVSPW